MEPHPNSPWPGCGAAVLQRRRELFRPCRGIRTAREAGPVTGSLARPRSLHDRTRLGAGDAGPAGQRDTLLAGPALRHDDRPEPPRSCVTRFHRNGREPRSPSRVRHGTGRPYPLSPRPALDERPRARPPPRGPFFVDHDGRAGIAAAAVCDRPGRQGQPRKSDSPPPYRRISIEISMV